MARGKKKKEHSTVVTLTHSIGGKQQSRDITVTRVVGVDVKNEFMHFDKLPDGTWRLTYSEQNFKDQ